MTLPRKPNIAHRPRDRARWAAALAGCALLAAGCGGGPSDAGVAHLGTPQPTSSPGASQTGPAVTAAPAPGRYADAIAYAKCMRKNGVAAFPDPSSRGGFQIKAGPGTGIDPGSSQFQHAQQICQKLLPYGSFANPAAQAKALAQALKFSQCMRAHGIKSFPDPQAHGGRISVGFGPASGINPNSPQFQAAQSVCQNLMPGKGGSVHTSSDGGRTAANG